MYHRSHYKKILDTVKKRGCNIYNMITWCPFMRCSVMCYLAIRMIMIILETRTGIEEESHESTERGVLAKIYSERSVDIHTKI